MKLYLARHGEAVSPGAGQERRLTNDGRLEVARVGALLAASGVRAARIFHSERERAAETAAILAEALGDGRPIEAREGLLPLDPVDPVAYEVNGWDEDTLLVGHLPFMPRLVSRLTAGDPERMGVIYPQGTVACLQRTGGGSWGLVWVVPPGLAAAR